MSGAQVLHTTISTCAHISLCHDPPPIFLVASSTTSFVPILTDGSTDKTTGWQLSIGGAVGAASQDQETASDRSRHHRFLWHSRYRKQGERQRKSDEGQDGSRRPDHGGHGAGHTAVGPTAQSLGSGTIGHVPDQLNCTHHSRHEGGGATVSSGDTRECRAVSRPRWGHSMSTSIVR